MNSHQISACPPGRRPVPGKNGGILYAQTKGQPALNPGGRPKGASIQAPFLRKMAEKKNKLGEGALAEKYADQLHAAIDAGDFEQVKFILSVMERTDPVDKKLELSVVPPPVLLTDVSAADAQAIAEGFGPQQKDGE